PIFQRRPIRLRCLLLSSQNGVIRMSWVKFDPAHPSRVSPLLSAEMNCVLGIPADDAVGVFADEHGGTPCWCPSSSLFRLLFMFKVFAAVDLLFIAACSICRKKFDREC